MAEEKKPSFSERVSAWWNTQEVDMSTFWLAVIVILIILMFLMMTGAISITA